MTKKTTMKTKTNEELSKLLADTRGELRTLRFEAAGARPKESNAPSKARKTIARVLTELTARSHGAPTASKKTA